MDDIRQRLASVAARFTAMKATASGAVAEVVTNREPGPPTGEVAENGKG